MFHLKIYGKDTLILVSTSFQKYRYWAVQLGGKWSQEKTRYEYNKGRNFLTQEMNKVGEKGFGT